MKYATASLCLVSIACLPLPAIAQNVEGNWQAQSISGVEPPEGAALGLAFGDEKTAKITYTLAGESQSWQYRYTVADGQLTLEPAKPFGEPEPIIYDIKFEEDKLLLLSPRPEPSEAASETAGDAESDEAEGSEEAAERDPDAEADQTDAEEVDAEDQGAEDEEDTRVPVWILVKA